jgi:hypothetical protein
MSQDAIDNVLVLNTGDDLDRSTAMTANLGIDIEHSLESRGQDIATGRSAGDGTSVLAIRIGPLPRLAGVTSPRQRWFGASTLW